MNLRQPKRGDVILECAHIGIDDSPDQIIHWYELSGDAGGIEFDRPDGTHDVADWLILCVECYVVFSDHNNSFDSIAVAGDSIYDGDGEIIRGTN